RRAATNKGQSLEATERIGGDHVRPLALTLLAYSAQQLGDHAIGGDSLGLRLVAQDQPMAKRRQRHTANVVEGDVDAASQHRVDLAGHDDRLRGAPAGAEAHVAPGALTPLTT